MQVVIVPTPPKKDNEEGKFLMDEAVEDLIESLKGEGLRVKVDDRDYFHNGAKYLGW